ncbi:MAG: Asp-tRNA(Asn)/Glu-tRNA(Gln) amidotransferase subunit GatA, partial [Aestuariivirga sp.]
MNDLTSLTIATAREGLRKKEFSAVELTEAYIAAIEKARILNAYIVETPDKARAMAKAS